MNPYINTVRKTLATIWQRGYDDAKSGEFACPPYTSIESILAYRRGFDAGEQE